MIVADFNTSFSTIDKSSRQKVNKENSEINYSIDQMDHTDIYRVLHLATAQTHSSQQPRNFHQNRFYIMTQWKL
jgi:hypothetical protein